MCNIATWLSNKVTQLKIQGIQCHYPVHPNCHGSLPMNSVLSYQNSRIIYNLNAVGNKLGLEVDAAQEISTMLMTSYYENVCWCKSAVHSSSLHVLFWQFALPFLGLVTHYYESWNWLALGILSFAVGLEWCLKNAYNFNCNSYVHYQDTW